MSKASTGTAQKLPIKSAWARGPPQSSSASASSRTQSPGPSSATPPASATHSRRPSALGQGVSVKDGVSVPRSNVSSVKQGSAVTFGSIDDASATAPASSSPANIPAIKAETVKSFGQVPAQSKSQSSQSAPQQQQVNGKPGGGPTNGAALKKFDVKSLFQNPSSAPSSAPSSSSPASSPSLRPSTLAPGHHPPPSAQGPVPSYTPFVPGAPYRPGQPPNHQQQQQNGPGPSGPQPPRSPVFARPPAVNGAAGGRLPPPGPGGPTPGGAPPTMSAGMPSPRMTPIPPHPGTPTGVPAGLPPPPMPWGYYSYAPYPMAGLPHEMHYPNTPWYMPPPMAPQQHQHQPPQHAPPTPGQTHAPIPVSPRNPPATIQGPGTPTHSHAVPTQHHHQHHAPSSSASNISSPPSTPSSLAPTGGPNGRLNSQASTFVPRAPKIVSIKSPQGEAVDVTAYAKKNASGTPSPAASPARRSTIIRMESEDARKKRLEDEAREEQTKKDAEDKKRRDVEEKERKEKEAEQRKLDEERRKKEEEEHKERRRKEEEEKARVRKEEEEKERIRKEEERVNAEKERLKKEEEERIRKEEEEAKERIRKEEEEEKERIRIEEEEEEKERVRKETEQKAETEKKSEEMEEGELEEEPPKEAKEAKEAEVKEKPKESPLRIDTDVTKRRPGPLDLTNAKQSNVSAPLPSALATARIIEDIGSVQYPEGIKSPRPELNVNAKSGKFRYDRDFLLQFMSICKEKPEHLPPLDAIGLDPVDQSHFMSRGGSSGSGRRQSTMPPPLSRQASATAAAGLGFQNFPSSLGKASGGFAMGQFGTTPGSKLSSEERFAMSGGGRGSAAGASAFGNRPPPMTRTASQGGPGGGSNRTRSKRGVPRAGDVVKPGGPQAPPMSIANSQSGMGSHFGGFPLEPVAPLQSSANRWVPQSAQRKPPEDSPELVDRKVKGLLNKLTMEKFDSISDQIIQWANKSENEKDGRTLIQVIRLVFEKATDEAAWSEMYARLCRKMMEQISPQVQDEGIKNNEGKPITGGQLFRKYLLNRCQEDFERGWSAKESAAAAAADKADADAALKASNEGKGEGEAELYSEEYYIAQKAKRQGLGLVKFIGELFKLQMLTERIMHECIKKLLSNVENPEEEEIESLCQLMSTVGQLLDTQRAKQYMDIYFARMNELSKKPKVSSRMQFMLQDVIELRTRNWIPRNLSAAPATIAQIHEAAAREKAASDRESAQRQISMSRGGSRRAQDRDPSHNADGWTTTTTKPPKAGDLSNFGKIHKAAGPPTTFGPSSVFTKKTPVETTKRDSSISRAASSSNMFSMLSQSPEITDEMASTQKSSRPSSRKTSIDLGPGGTPSEPPQRRRLQLLPRTKPLEAKDETPSASAAPSDDEDESGGGPSMSEEEAKKKIGEDSKEFFAIRNLDEAEHYFSKLPTEHRYRLVDALVTKAIEARAADAELVASLFERATEKGLCPPASFEEGFVPTAEILDDIAIDVPKALDLMAVMMKGAGLDKDEERRGRIVGKCTDSDKLLSLLSS